MRDLKENYGNWCLVAGSVDGLGRAFSESLARRGFSVILVDVQEDPLKEQEKMLAQNYGIGVRGLCLDLAGADSVEILMREIRETGCRLLIYNAAFSRVKRFTENDPQELDRYVRVNVSTLLQLLHAFALHHPGDPQGRAGVIMLSSLAGVWGSRLLAPYGATKAFTRILAEALHHELQDTGIDILVSVTGATATPGYLSSLSGNKMPPGGVMRPEKVVEACLKDLGNRAIVIPGLRNRVAYFLLTRVFSRSRSVKIMNREVSKLYRE